MSAPRFGRIQKATALVPLALLSAAWTANLAGVSGTATASDSRLPDGSMVPIEALEDPASFSIPGNIGLGIAEGQGDQIVAAASTNGIPTAALAAYQRAETVINGADPACHIDWQLVAAIGRVESDHGRYGGNVLDTKGVSHPGIYGIALDGTRNTQAISDTDAGQYDNDKVWDRAVGAMQFIPSTWSVVGVDADGDGKRNPQDIDDAALASAVYLCSGDDDLGTIAGRRASVFRYNHSQAYVDLVLRVRDAYLAGDYTAVPNYITSAYSFSSPSSYTPYGGSKKGMKGGAGALPPGSTFGQGGAPGTEAPVESGTPGGLPGGGGGTPSPTPKPPTSGTAGLKEVIDGTAKTVDKILAPSPGPSATSGPVEQIVNGVLGPLNPLLAQVQCGLAFPLDAAKQQECIASYK